MDELAAAAAVVAMSIDDDGEEDSELEDAPVAAAAGDVLLPAVEAAGVGVPLQASRRGRGPSPV